MTEDLTPLPCPWCNEVPEVVKGTTPHPAMPTIYPFVRCVSSDCPVGPSGREHTSERAAVAAWNRRALPSGGDTERLDWMDQRGQDIRVSSGVVRVWHQQGSTEPQGSEKREPVSLREAIDAARALPESSSSPSPEGDET